MPLQFHTSVNLAQFELAARRYVNELGLEVPKVVQRSSRLFVVELLRLTPPKTYAQGRAAVKRDIGRAMFLLDPNKIHNLVLRQAVLDQEYEVVEAFVNNIRKYGKTGFFSRNRLAHFSRDQHTNSRDQRGRVQRPKGVFVLERSEYNAYVKEMQGHVGATKFGWAISGRRLGVSIPSWVLGHSETQGGYEENLGPQDSKIVMTNRAPGIPNVGTDQIQRIVNVRTRAMNRDVEQILAGRAANFK